MCKICENAGTKLEEMLDQLENNFPGGEVDGEQVERGHHVEVAVMGAAISRLSAKAQMMLGVQLFKINGFELAGIVPPGGPQKQVKGPFTTGKVIDA